MIAAGRRLASSSPLVNRRVICMAPAWFGRSRSVIPAATIEALGGPQMEQAGATLRYHMEGLAAFGVVESCHQDPGPLSPAAGPAGRFPGRALRSGHTGGLSRFPSPGGGSGPPAGTKVLYYIAPQLWAWRPERARRLAAAVDRLAVVLPFEQSFSTASGFEVNTSGIRWSTVAGPGRPRQARAHLGIPGREPVLGDLPGEPEPGDPPTVGAVPRRGATSCSRTGVVTGYSWPGTAHGRLSRSRRAIEILRGTPHPCWPRPMPRWPSRERRRSRRPWRERQWWLRTRFTRSAGRFFSGCEPCAG